MHQYNKYKEKKTVHQDRDARVFYHYSISHKTLCETLVKRIELKKDNVILITGPTGSGKSTLAGKMCFNFFENMDNILTPGEKMYTDSNFIINPEDFAKRMINDKGSVLWWDESRDGLSSKNWNKEINKTIVSRKNKNRKRGITYLILLPHEGEVDKSFLKHVTMWIWIKERRIGQVFVAANPRMGGFSLSIPNIIDRQNKWLKENPNRRVVLPTIHPEYVGNIIFGAMTSEQEKRYDRLVEKHQATGKLSEEEQEQGSEISKEEIEEIIPKIIDMVSSGEIKTKREMWDRAKEATKLSDSKLISYFNRHLGIRGLKKFNNFEI